jgi:lysozyme
MANEVYGVDLSRWDNDINYKVFFYTPPYTEFAIIKSTQGTWCKDSRYNQHRTACIESAVYNGAYHYWEVASRGETQAKFFMANTKRTELVSLDVEDLAVPSTISYDYQKAIVGNLKSFLKAIESEWGIKPVIYTANWWWQDRLGNLDAELAEYDLWVANYITNPALAFSGTAKPYLPTPWRTRKKPWKIWQYGVHPHIGEGTALDSNVWCGTRDEFYQYLKLPVPLKREVPKITVSFGQITVPMRYIRNGPGTQYGIIGHLHQGESIFIESFIEAKGEKWGKLQDAQPKYVFLSNGVRWISQP